MATRDELQALLTVEDAKKWRMIEGAHYNGGAEFFAYLHRCVEQPRLSRFDKYLRKSQSIESTWRIDGIDRASLAEAIAALNTPPAFDDEEVAYMATVPAEFTPKPKGIDWAINERVVNKGAVEWQKGQYRLTTSGRAFLSAKIAEGQ